MAGSSKKKKNQQHAHRSNSTSNNHKQTSQRDPSDDQAQPLINSSEREREWNNVRSGKQQQQGGRGSGNGNKKKTSKLSQQQQQQQQLRQQSLPQKHKKQSGQSSQASQGLGKFIGRDINGANGNDESIVHSQLTTPSAIRSNGDEYEDDDGSYSTIDDDNQPLLKSKNSSELGKSNKHKNKKNKGKGSTPKHFARFMAETNGNGTKVQRGTSALSMRKNQTKRPWFKNKLSNGTAHNLGNTHGPRNPTSTSSVTGVQYRSASSTQRALEEIKRKKLMEQEKQRAVFILVGLFILASCVHFMGGNKSSTDGGGIKGMILGGKGSSTVGLKGSKDKVYGTTKDLGYGGERTALDGGGGLGGTQELGVEGSDRPIASNYGLGNEDEYTYELPPATEKVYDTEHEFLSPLKYFADVNDPNRPSDTAYFFHVPRAGGSTIKSIIGKCLKLVQSSEVGVRDGHDQDATLQVVDVQESKYMNVDTTTIPGIQRAVDLGLSTSGLTNVIVSSYFHESAALFDLQHQGRAFILFRDPIERATSMYWHRIKEVGDLDDTTSIEDYAQGNGIENNWMTRFLANRMTGELTKDDLEQAKEILKSKFLIGFIDDLEESVARMMKYNSWKYSIDETEQMKEEDCIKDMITSGSNSNAYEYEIPKRGSQAHALISWQTQFDMKLYTYAKEIFEHQTKEWGTKERKKMLKKEKKKAKQGGR